MKTERRTIYWTCIHGERYSVAASKEEATALIRYDMKELQTKREEWKIEEEVLDLPLVAGELVTPDNAWPFVRWTCPHTGDTLQSELGEEETSPALFFTGEEGRVALVDWEER
ncbi:MAG: hypothetical protein ACYTGH_05325 [Planctomycetota bacterium]|jgi:hypothetical protein